MIRHGESMPPGLSSTLFVTYQPGSTEIDCPPGTELFTEFDNDDGFPVGMGDLTKGPFLAGITNGVFTPLVACDVVNEGATVSCGPIKTPFDFAWYHTDIRPPDPCRRTTVIGRVIDESDNGMSVAGASVSVPGAVPVLTDANGEFSIPNVPAGPNGPRCFSDPFTIRASASKDLSVPPNGALESEEFGVSKLASAVPGGPTDVMDIRLGLEGGAVQGRMLKLSSVVPFVVTPLPGAFIDLFPSAGGRLSDTTDNSGNYSFPDVPQGTYGLDAEFSGELPLPGGGTKFEELFGGLSGNIDFAAKVEVKDFRFTITGAVQVTVEDAFGNRVPHVPVELTAFGGDLGSGFVAPEADCSAFADADGIATFSASDFSCFSREQESLGGVPMGPCEVRVVAFNNGFPRELGTLGPDNGCFVNQHGEFLELTVDVVLPGEPGDVVMIHQSLNGDQLFIPVEYAEPVSRDECFDIHFRLEFDTDRTLATGAPSLISTIAPDPTGLGVELTLECDPFFCTLRRADGTEVYADTSAFGCENRPEGDFTTILIALRPNEFVAAAGGPGPYNMALLSMFGEQVFGFWRRGVWRRGIHSHWIRSFRCGA